MSNMRSAGRICLRALYGSLYVNHRRLVLFQKGALLT
jgi:hypothetical protein